ncbi:MAG TPA: hypothetical protein VE954_31220 [Oligoflexus sp.]|uniref:hypothetical protein n=1 Tax=Oligoflexus sp. TaxID=1971216 RepID=UPI002D5715C6|nr:hypothetical protein [Oligoflexus sp.]HYX37595.1 hypothetical protein [Oligoflexus sp.]
MLRTAITIMVGIVIATNGYADESSDNAIAVDKKSTTQWEPSKTISVKAATAGPKACEPNMKLVKNAYKKR